VALITPALTLGSALPSTKPNGLPIATAHSPTSSASELPSGATGHAARVHLEDGEVDGLVDADDARRVAGAVGQRDQHAARAAHHVGVGDQHAVGADEEAGADARAPLLGRPAAAEEERERVDRRALDGLGLDGDHGGGDARGRGDDRGPPRRVEVGGGNRGGEAGGLGNGGRRRRGRAAALRRRVGGRALAAERRA
jgi:hypothetical protein